MAKRTIEIGTCLNEEPHGEHKFRPGIFGLGRKVLCKGVPKTTFDSLLTSYCEADVKATAAFYDAIFGLKEEPHRCYYRFNPEESCSITMAWKCEDPFCGHEYFRFRSAYNYQSRVTRENFRWSWR